MNVLVFGASGGTGREVVKQALGQGHSLTAFVRAPAKFGIDHSHLTVVQGDVLDYASVERAVENQAAVICALGSSTPLKRDSTLIDGVRNILMAIGQAGRRFIYLSFLGVRDGRNQLSFLGKYIIAPLLLRNVVVDHEAKEALIKKSRLDWIIVRPPRLTNGRRTGTYRSGEGVVATSIIPTISRADVAEFMVKQLTDDRYLHKAVNVMY
jgi:putative NADH-flavin reductase